MGEKRFAVLLCAEDSEYVKKLYGGYFEVFVGMLGDEGETWDLYRVINGDFPQDEELKCYDGFVLTGSCSDAHGNDLWILNLVNLLKKLDSMNKKILGICFGHQILCRALGGKTGRAASGWDLGVRMINFLPSKHFSSALKLPVYECHRDEVWELPPHAEVIGRSDKTAVEVFKYKEHIMGIQGHPEYTKGLFLSIVNRLLHCNLIQESEAVVGKTRAEEQVPDGEAWKRLCKSFLKGSKPTAITSLKPTTTLSLL
ncbi:gamma-glutamyl peptidase 5-like [Telopea speciosissima]|uniref:gamma-glutamyl peptidase 5-like n=1 Tax=Telopea speciosissima TaxID=54955 RepID=UPI001CC5C83B|nr:gamma-glutamyl peptidase 5-like [Telopea speciosissima]